MHTLVLEILHKILHESSVSRIFNLFLGDFYNILKRCTPRKNKQKKEGMINIKVNQYRYNPNYIVLNP